MTKITYIEFNGDAHTVDIEDGKSVMQGAVENLITGIVAECGGSCSCGTCHCYVEPSQMPLVGPPNEDEQDLLDFAANVQETSRLSCQIKVTEALEGLTVRLPESQY